MTLTIALAQLNPKVGDLTGNTALLRRARDSAAALDADLVVFPELSLVGYPPEDLVLRPAFVEAAAHALRQLEHESRTSSPALAIGLPWRQDGNLYNAVAVVDNGRTDIRLKHELPNYGVFDEKRVFTPGPLPEPIEIRGVRLGLPICEDIWFPTVACHLAGRGAALLLVPNGSPFEVEKFDQRLELARQRASESHLPLAYLNQVGGQDELVFDGGSFVMNSNGSLSHVLPFWREALVITRWAQSAGRYACDGQAGWTAEPRLSTIYNAMACPAGSTRRSRLSSPSTLLAPTAFGAYGYPRSSPARRAWRMRPRQRPRSGCGSTP